MKTRWRPFFQQVQQLRQTVSRHLSTRHLQPSNPQWEQAKAEARTWKPVLTLEQEEDESWLNSEVQVCILSTPPSMSHISDMDTIAEMPAINIKKVMSHILDEPDTFAAIANELLTPGVKDKTLIPRIRTADLQATEHITNSLRSVNTTDPFLPSTRMTPNHEFAIVPRRATAQLPPRLGDDTADSPEHVTPVETLINRAIVTFHQEQTRLPHAITISYIRFPQHWINNPRHRHFFFYKAEYGDVEIPINGALMG